MMKTLLLAKSMRMTCYALALLGSVVISSCSKEKRIEKKLTHIGDWTIAEAIWVKVTEEVNDPDNELSAFIGVESGSRKNAGTISFKEGGTGSFDYELDEGMERKGTMIWTAEGGEVSITDVSNSVLDIFNNLFGNLLSGNPNAPEFTFHQELFGYVGERTKRNEFLLEGGGVIQIYSEDGGLNVGQYVYTITITLVK